ncbi:MAG TPA: hypothetical protein VGV69_08790 [Solirubrobacterales bacterium]|nr:hypothetical protein [Solirubrobacterales bacterium]
MSERELSTGEVDQLRNSLREKDEEILRLRDLLVGKDVELGVAKGRLAEHEDRAKRLANAKKRVEAKVPVFGRLVGPILRLLRGRP